MKKYKLTAETKIVLGNKIYRIEALRNFTTINNREVKEGDKGGWVQFEDNLSHEGLCWLFDEAIGMENSKRIENAVGFENSQQYGYSCQSGNSWQSGNSQQYENSQQSGDSRQSENSRQYGNSQQYENSRQSG